MVTVVLSWVVLAEWKLDFIPDNACSGVLHVGVADHFGYLLPVFLATLYRSGVVAFAVATLS